MKKIIGAALVATLVGSLSANATVILSDDFSVTGGTAPTINTEWDTRQSGTSLSPWTAIDGGASDIYDPLSNGGTARVSGTLNGASSIGLVQNNWMTGMSGEKWSMSFLATSFVGVEYTSGWFGFGLTTDSFTGNTVGGKFGAIHRSSGDMTLFANGAAITIGTFPTAYNPYSNIIKYTMVGDEAASTLTLSYDAYDKVTLGFLGHVDVLSGVMGFDGNNRGLDFRLSADTTTGDAPVAFLIDDVLIETIPEPATLGLVAMVGGALLFIRKKFMI